MKKYLLLCVGLFLISSLAMADDGIKNLKNPVLPSRSSLPMAVPQPAELKSTQGPDWGPYMRDLQRRIKMNWNPPKSNETKKVVLVFSIARDGSLLSTSVLKSSGDSKTDNAALEAVKLSSPFRPLPVEFKGQKVDLQFIFDYNVLGVSRY